MFDYAGDARRCDVPLGGFVVSHDAGPFPDKSVQINGSLGYADLKVVCQMLALYPAMRTKPYGDIRLPLIRRPCHQATTVSHASTRFSTRPQ